MPETPDDQDGLSAEEVAALQTERDAMQAELDALKAMDPADIVALLGVELAVKTDESEDDDDDLPEEVRKQIDDAQDKVEKAEERIAKMESDNRRREFIAKAKTDYDSLGDADDLGEVLHSIDDNVDEAIVKRLDAILKAANAQVAEGALFAEVGHGLPGGDDGDRLKALAKAEQEQDGDLTDAQATEKALSKNPELWKR